MGEIVLRRGQPEDSEAAIAVWLSARAARRGGHPASAEREAHIRASMRKPDAFLVVADDAGTIVGMAVGMQGLADDGAGPPADGLCFIFMVFVSPDRWGEGIGGRTVDALLDDARTRGFDRAQLWTYENNRPAQRLYEGRGFRRTGREQDHDFGERIVQYEVVLSDRNPKEAMRFEPSHPPSPCPARSSPPTLEGRQPH
jgi:ribosomal protein S18 acetylase RimI-like enzyme